jgi:transitional endoplasmic reticulum ATPase
LNTDQSTLYEMFLRYYNLGTEAKKNGDQKSASNHFLKSSEYLLKLALVSEPAVKKARYEHAMRIKELALQMTEKKEEKQSVDTKDKTETLWEESDIPSVSFQDVAGLDSVKESVNMRIILPLKHKEVFQTFKKKLGGGILLYGPPGTGKSMIAQAIAHEAQAKFFSVKTSDIVSKWFGEAERNIKNLFETARSHERSVIFFDEFEALGTKRGGNSTVMNRIVPELLAQIQGFSQSNTTLLLLAATNRPWDVDSALLRPGRFNELIYIPLPDEKAREYIIKKHLSDIPIDKDVNFNMLIEETKGFSGADVTEFCDKVKTDPILRTIKSGKIEPITQNDIIETLSKMGTSIMKSDLLKFDSFMKERNDHVNQEKKR